MRIVWDEHKRLANLDKHEMDFGGLAGEFFVTALILNARDRRLTAIGRFEDGVAMVIFAPLGSEAISVISMRPASARERRYLDEH